MKYGLLFLLLGVVLLMQSALVGGLWWLLLWPGLSFAIVGLAYLAIGPRVFGKRTDGTMAWWAVLLLLPYLLLTWFVWHAVRMISKEPCYNEVVPGLFVGRRPLAGELPPNVALVVDLTAEFPAVRSIKDERVYVAFPTLDASTADESAFRQLVERITQCSDPVYIHCAQGHGRTGTLAAAVLVARGYCANIDEAVSTLQRARPRLDLSRRQLEYLKRVCRGAA
jgi:protein-tyrosine phosphatase